VGCVCVRVRVCVCVYKYVVVWELYWSTWYVWTYSGMWWSKELFASENTGLNEISCEGPGGRGLTSHDYMMIRSPLCSGQKDTEGSGVER
jgi:hypothetical protein